MQRQHRPIPRVSRIHGTDPPLLSWNRLNFGYFDGIRCISNSLATCGNKTFNLHRRNCCCADHSRGNGAPTVAAHLLAGLALLGGATVTAVASLVDKRDSETPRLGGLGWSAIGAAGILYLSGSLVVNAEAEKACASFPLCPSSQPTHLVVLHILHRSIALIAGVTLIAFAISAWRNWSQFRGARVLATALVALIATTATLGIFSALRKAPADLQDLHLAGAAGVLIASVALASLGWLSAADNNTKGSRTKIM